MLIIGEDPGCRELRHVKGDDFYKIFDGTKEDGTPFDPAGFAFQWVISNPSSDIAVIDGVIDGYEVEFSAPASTFDSMNFIGEYTHSLRETTTNTTISRGPFKLV